MNIENFINNDLLGRLSNKQRKYFLPCNPKCIGRHRKWPTPEQFREKYGKEYQDDGAVYFYNDVRKNWFTSTMQELKKWNGISDWKNTPLPIVCACTPWGKPPDDWRPENKGEEK